MTPRVVEMFRAELERSLLSTGIDASHIARALDAVGAVAYEDDDSAYIAAATCAASEALAPLLAELQDQSRAAAGYLARAEVEAARVDAAARVWEVFHNLRTTKIIH